jgi:hypothetical protein
MMTKRTKKTELDKIADKLHVALQKESAGIIESGELMIESRQHLDHGQWMPWLAENFDLSYRTATRYIGVAEYVAKCDTVANFEWLAPTVLYQLADGKYNEAEEKAIRAAIQKQAVGPDLAMQICAELKAPEPKSEPPEPAPKPEPEGDEEDEEDEDSILDGPPPDLPPPEPAATTDFLLPAFEQAIKQLKDLQTKPLHKFASTYHQPADIAAVADFLQQVAAAKKSKAA